MVPIVTLYYTGAPVSPREGEIWRSESPVGSDAAHRRITLALVIIITPDIHWHSCFRSAMFYSATVLQGLGDRPTSLPEYHDVHSTSDAEASHGLPTEVRHFI